MMKPRNRCSASSFCEQSKFDRSPTMKKSTLLASAAVALLMSSAAASAQVQQKGSEEKSPQAAPKEQGATSEGRSIEPEGRPTTTALHGQGR
jgi:hypothetical protein